MRDLKKAREKWLLDRMNGGAIAPYPHPRPKTPPPVKTTQQQNNLKGDVQEALDAINKQ